MVGLSKFSNYERPKLYCKLSYDKEKGCWVWVENLPPERKTRIIKSLEPSEEVKYNGPYINGLVQTPYVYSVSTSISYNPGNRVGHIRYGALNGIFGKRFHSCPFCTSDRVKASFYPDGSIGLRFIDVPWGNWARLMRNCIEDQSVRSFGSDMRKIKAGYG